MPKSESDPFGGKDAPHGVILKIITTNICGSPTALLTQFGVLLEQFAVALIEQFGRIGPHSRLCEDR